MPGYTTRYGPGDGKTRSFARWSARPDIQMATECLTRYRAKSPVGQLQLVARYVKTIHPYGRVLPQAFDGPLPLPAWVTREEPSHA